MKADAVGHIYSAVAKPYPSPSTWEEALKRNGPETFRSYLKFCDPVVSVGRQSNGRAAGRLVATRGKRQGSRLWDWGRSACFGRPRGVIRGLDRLHRLIIAKSV